MGGGVPSGGNLVSMTRIGPRRSRRDARPGSWQLQEAKARFSEVVRLAKHQGPQHVTVHGREEVVVVGADEFRRLAGEHTGKALIAALQRSPHRSVSLQPSRSRMRVRDVDL
jgi:prevent-host-death family protein